MAQTQEYYRNISELEYGEKWLLLMDFISHPTKEYKYLALDHRVKIGSISPFIRNTYMAFQNASETRALVNTAIVRRKDTLVLPTETIRKISSKNINNLFLSRLSGDEDEALSDNELLFVELYIESGDDIRAIVESGLDIGLNGKSTKGRSLLNYYDSCKLRAFYLKRKPNISVYLDYRRKERLETLEEGKEYIQEKLLGLIENLENAPGAKNNTAILKAIETLGKTLEGVFENKVTIENVNGDDALDRLIARAKGVGTGELVADV